MVDILGVVAFDCRIDEMVSTAIQLCRVMLYGGVGGSLCQVLRTGVYYSGILNDPSSREDTRVH